MVPYELNISHLIPVEIQDQLSEKIWTRSFAITNGLSFVVYTYQTL